MQNQHQLTVFYITNRPDVVLVAEKYGVNRIWVDVEQRGKEERQHNLNTVKSNHTVADVARIKPLLPKAEMLVRVNPWYDGSPKEIDAVVKAGADIIMLPYWKTAEEVKAFTAAFHGRCRTTLLLETKEAVECVDDVLALGGFDEIHIGLNDLHLFYGMTFMFMEAQLCTGRSSLKTVTYVQNTHQICQENRANCPLMAA